MMALVSKFGAGWPEGLLSTRFKGIGHTHDSRNPC